MSSPRTRVSPQRRARSGLYVVPELAPDPPRRACDDESLVLKGTIYAFPIWEINPRTGMIILYQADPATGVMVLGVDGTPTKVAEVPGAALARADAKPRIVWDYVGQTIRELDIREAEHVADKCWADLIAGRPIVIESGVWDKKTRDGREIARIAELKPRFNKEYNEHNPDRIEIWRQVELRHARDRALHLADWLPLEERTAVAVEAAERAIIGAGLDGNEPRYPLTVLGEVLAGLGRWLWALPRRVKTTAAAVVAWAATVLTAAHLLTAAGWPVAYAYTGPVTMITALLLAAGGRRRRKRRRRRR